MILINTVLDFLTFVEMFTPQEKAECVFWFIESKSDIQTQKDSQLNMQNKF